MVFIVVLILAIGLFIFFSSSSAVTTNIDKYEYDLPFKKGAKYRVVQGYGGLFSHTHIAALDFDMPTGTPVYAARDGIIYNYKDDSDEGGILPSDERKANFLIIKHDDGSFGCYWHLKKNGVVARTGPVKKGQVIGFSGSTGFTLLPHLHFSVKRILNHEMESYLRTRFRTTDGIKLLKNGEVYERPVKT